MNKINKAKGGLFVGVCALLVLGMLVVGGLAVGYVIQERSEKAADDFFCNWIRSIERPCLAEEECNPTDIKAKFACEGYVDMETGECHELTCLKDGVKS